MSAWIPFGPAFQFPDKTQTPQTKALLLLFWDDLWDPMQLRPGAIRDFLPRCCGDLRTVIKCQLFQQGRLTQGFKQICNAICSFRVRIKAPAVFCQNQSVEFTLGLRQVQVPNPSSELVQLPTDTNICT